MAQDGNSKPYGFFEKQLPQQTEVPLKFSARFLLQAVFFFWFTMSLAGAHGVERHRGHQHEIPDLAP